MSAMRKLIVIAFLLLSSCSSNPGKTTLIVYSPHGKELLTEFEIFLHHLLACFGGMRL